MTGIAELALIPHAISSMNSAFQLAKGLVLINDTVKLNNTVIELQGLILEAQSSLLNAQAQQQELQQKIYSLEADLKKGNSWDMIAANYKLKKVERAVFVYESVSNENGDPLHWICATCYEAKKKSILQRTGILSRCLSCSSTVNACLSGDV